MSAEYTHNCESCTYLGTFRPPAARPPLYDLYFCAQGGLGSTGTLVARYSSEAPDYTSAPPGVVLGLYEPLEPPVAALRTAYWLALDAGLLKGVGR